MANLVLAFADQAFNRVMDSRLITGDFDVGDSGNIQWDPSFGVGVFHSQLDDHVAEVEAHHFLQNGNAQSAAAPHRAIANLAPIACCSAQTSEDQNFAGLTDVIELTQKHDKGPEACCSSETNGKKHHCAPVDDKVPIRSTPRMSLTCSKN